MKKYLLILLAAFSLNASAQDTTLVTVTLTAGDWASVHSIIRNDPNHEDMALMIVRAITNESLGVGVAIPNIQSNWIQDYWRTLNNFPYSRVATFIGRVRTGFTGTGYSNLTNWITAYDNDLSADILLRRNISMLLLRRY